MKKLAILVAVVATLTVSSMTAFAQQPDKSVGVNTSVNYTNNALAWDTQGDHTLKLGVKYDVHANTSNNATVTYSVSNSQVASVDANGIVTTLSNGQTTLTATSGTSSITKTLTVGTVSAPVVAQTTTPTMQSDANGSFYYTSNGHIKIYSDKPIQNAVPQESVAVPKLTQEDLNWIIADMRAYGESKGLTWSTRRSTLGDYYLGGYDIPVGTEGSTKEKFSDGCKFAYLDNYIKHGVQEFYIEFKANEYNGYDIYVYRG